MKLEIEEDGYAERREERGRRRGRKIETGSESKTNLARPREQCMQMCAEAGRRGDQIDRTRNAAPEPSARFSIATFTDPVSVREHGKGPGTNTFKTKLRGRDLFVGPLIYS